MSQYATGNVLRSLGVIDGRDMTTEATVTKLAFLLGGGLRGADLKLAMETNLRGELTLTNSQDYAVNEHVRNSEYVSMKILAQAKLGQEQQNNSNNNNNSSSSSSSKNNEDSKITSRL